MSDRSGLNWALVGHRSDPITGDPGSVDAHAQHYTATAQNLERAQSNLDNLQSDDLTCSEAVEAILARAREMSGLLQAIEVRYVTIGDALKVYAPSLKEAQRVSAEAVAEATAAAQRKRSSAQAANEAALRYKSFDEAERTRAQEDYYTYKAAAARAQGDIDDAKAKVLAAIASRDEAASGAETRIRSVIDDSAVNDSPGDKLENFFTKVAQTIQNVAKWVWDNIDAILAFVAIVALISVTAGAGWAVAAAVLVAISHRATIPALKRVAQAAGVLGNQILRIFTEGRIPQLAEIGAGLLLVGATTLGVGINAIAGKDLRFFDDGEPWAGEPSTLESAWTPNDFKALTDNTILAYETDGVIVQTVVGPDGATRYIVSIPGTEPGLADPAGWFGNRNGRDWPANLWGIANGRSSGSEAVALALERAGVPRDAEILLTGHSQGGILAANVAADKEFSSKYRVAGVVTYGSPIECADLPQDIPVLAVQNKWDPVPRLDLGGSLGQAPNVQIATVDVNYAGLFGDHDYANYKASIDYLDPGSDAAKVIASYEQRNGLDRFYANDSSKVSAVNVPFGRAAQ